MSATNAVRLEQVSELCQQLRVGNAPAKTILCFLARRAVRYDRWHFASVERGELETATEFAGKTCRRAIRYLAARNWLTVTVVRGRYRINVELIRVRVAEQAPAFPHRSRQGVA